MKSCPYCEAEIANSAKKCKYCWEVVVEKKEVRLCPYCEAEVSETAKKCRYCWEFLTEIDHKESMTLEKEFKWEENEITYKKSFRIFIINIVKDIVIVAFILWVWVPHNDEDSKAFVVIFLCVLNEIVRLIINLVKVNNQKWNGCKKHKSQSKSWLYLKSFWKFLNYCFRDFMIVFMVSYLVLSTDTMDNLSYYPGVGSKLRTIIWLAFSYEIIRFVIDIVKISKSKK